ncbi:hypothetical protein GGI11_002833 [Coemansia sp. RSA 2049]|nr:hypothetical protein GGI11_002833 [Coemansia sp. RSA 2049]
MTTVGLGHVVLSVYSPHCADIPIPWLGLLDEQAALVSDAQSSELYSPNRWQAIIRRQLLNTVLTRGQSLSLRIGSRQVDVTVLEVFAVAETSRISTDSIQIASVDSGAVIERTAFSTRKKLEPDMLISGYEDIVCSLTHDVREYFSAKELYACIGMGARQIAYVHGFSGVGKTAIINEALKRAGIPVIYRDMHEIIVSDSGSEPANAYTSASLDDLISRIAAAAIPVAMLLDHVDSLVNTEIVENVTELGNCFARFLHRLPSNVFVVLESSVDLAKMPGAIKRLEPRLHCHEVSMPRLWQRKEIVFHNIRRFWSDGFLEKTDHGSDPAFQTTTAIVERIANSAAGYVARDIAALCRQVALHRLRRIQKEGISVRKHGSKTEPEPDGLLGTLSQLSLDTGDKAKPLAWEDVEYALAIVRPSQHVEFESERPSKKWTDIGGYTRVVEKLKQLMQLTTRETSTRLGVKAPRGILLHGPSGCGKTAMALAMISESGCSVISIRSSELFSKYLGETEARLRRLFAAARAATPCIVFIDEVDSLAAKRSTHTEHVGGPELRILSTLLNEMDGIHGTSRVVVVGCTNKITQIDDAALRPGRFDQHIEVGLPTDIDRARILETLGRQSCLADDVNIGKLASSTHGFTGAALEQLFREAGLSALRRGNGLGVDVIEMRDFETGLSRMQYGSSL